MAVARFNLAFRFGHEDNGTWETCAIARLLQDGQGGWRQDPDFIPPMALFSASRNLCERLALLNRQLRSPSASQVPTASCRAAHSRARCWTGW